MESKGYVAPRLSKLKYDAKKLAAIGGVRSIESARKWLTESIPRNDQLARIAAHFGVNKAWLRDGEGPQFPHELPNQPSDLAGLGAEAIEIARCWQALPTDARTLLRQLIYTQAMLAQVNPSLVLRPVTEGYVEFKTKVTNSFRALKLIKKA